MPRATRHVFAALLLGCAGGGGEDTGATSTDAADDTSATTDDTSATEGASSTDATDAMETTDATETTGAPATETVVWLGAHPDDELYAAPWLADRCLERGASCKLVVLTFGESGNCKLPGGCEPDLKSVRIGKGEKAKGWVTFEVPEKASGLKLTYNPFIIGTAKQELKFDLGR